MNVLVVSSAIITDSDIDGNMIRKRRMITELQANGVEVILLMYAPFTAKKKGAMKNVHRFKTYTYPSKL